MTISEMLGQSAIITVLGISVVFSFLCIMIFFITLTGRIVTAKGAANQLVNSALASQAPQGTGSEKDPQVIAAITAGIAEYRKSESPGRG